MHEHESPTPQTEQRWSSRQIADTLGVPARPQQDEQGGRGARYELGTPEEPVQLAVYPTGGIVHVTLPGATVELSGSQPPHLRPDAVIFTTAPDTGRRPIGLYLNRRAEVFMGYMQEPDAASVQSDVPSPSAQDAAAALAASTESEPAVSTAQLEVSSQAPESTQVTVTASQRAETQPTPKREPTGHPSAPGALSQEPTGTKPERPSRVRLSGEVKSVAYREPTTADKAPSLEMTIAHQQGEQTVYSRVYTTRQRARQFKDMVKRGEQVSIVGYPQQRVSRLPDGTEHEEIVLYALGLKVTASAPHPPHP